LNPDLASLKILQLMYKLSILPYFWGHILLPDAADMKNNGKFGFGIPRNIKSMYKLFQLNTLIFTPYFDPFWAPFWPPCGYGMKNNGRFGFGIPKNIKIDA